MLSADQLAELHEIFGDLVFAVRHVHRAVPDVDELAAITALQVGASTRVLGIGPEHLSNLVAYAVARYVAETEYTDGR